jgi:hypothetical protein
MTQEQFPEAAAHPASVDMNVDLLHQSLMFVLAIGNAVMELESLRYILDHTGVAKK